MGNFLRISWIIFWGGAEILTIFWEKRWVHKFSLKFTDLYWVQLFPTDNCTTGDHVRIFQQLPHQRPNNDNFTFLKFIYSEKAAKFCPMWCQSNWQWRFRKILRPSQNIWTLPCKIFGRSMYDYKNGLQDWKILISKVIFQC